MAHHARLIGCFIAAAIAAGAPSTTAASWIPDGIPVCPAAASTGGALIISDWRGGAIVAWTDTRAGAGDVYAQRISLEGEFLWNPNGLPVCADPAAQQLLGMVPDGAGGAIIVWNDARSPDGGIYAQSVSADGAARWAAGGAPVCTPSPAYSGLGVVPAGEGEAIISWIIYENDTGNDDSAVYAQKMTASGSRAWTPGGALCASVEECIPIGYCALSDGQAGAILIWRCIIAGCLWGQRIDWSGTLCWGSNGHEIARASYDPYGIAAASDGFGGALAMRRDVIFGGGIFTLDVLRAQRVAHDGTALWPSAINLDYSDFSYMAIAPDGTGGAIAVWCSQGSALVAQRLDAAGSPLWGSGRSVTSSVNWFDLCPKVIPDGSGGAIVVWTDRQEAGNLNVYAQRIDRNGNLLWGDRVPLCAAAGNQTNPAIATNCAGGAIAAWTDERLPELASPYAQTVNALGAPGEPPVAVLLEGFSGAAIADGIEVQWTLSSAIPTMRFEVERAAESGGDFEPFDVSIAREGASYRFVDHGAAAGAAYRYRVTALEGEYRWILFETGSIRMPSPSLALHQNYPNPFNPATRITYYLPEAMSVLLEIYDSSGRNIAVLANGPRDKGPHEIEWTARSESGEPIASGAYYCRLKAGKSTLTRKIILVR